MELGQVVRPHKPHKFGLWEASRELCDSIHSVARIELKLDSGGHDPRAAGLRFGGFQPGSQISHIIPGLQRIAGRHQPPAFVQPKRVDRKARDPAMAAMSGVKAASKKADAAWNLGHIVSLQRRFSRAAAKCQRPATGRITWFCEAILTARQGRVVREIAQSRQSCRQMNRSSRNHFDSTGIALVRNRP